MEKEFHEAFQTALDRAITADIQYQSRERITLGDAVQREEVINGFKRYYGIVDGVISNNTEINATYDGLAIYGEIPQSLYANLQEYQYLVENRLPMYYKMYLQRQLDEYKTCVRYLGGLRNFLYYIEDEAGNPVGGNTTKGEISDEKMHLIIKPVLHHILHNAALFLLSRHPYQVDRTQRQQECRTHGFL